jgi:hypothetical protein
MIPYDELVESLANWRVKQGMSTRPASGGGHYAASASQEEVRGVVPENDFGRQDGTGEVDLEQYVVEGGEDE